MPRRREPALLNAAICTPFKELVLPLTANLAHHPPVPDFQPAPRMGGLAHCACFGRICGVPAGWRVVWGVAGGQCVADANGVSGAAVGGRFAGLGVDLAGADLHGSVFLAICADFAARRDASAGVAGKLDKRDGGY